MKLILTGSSKYPYLQGTTQLLTGGEVYQLRPDFLMPYMIGKTDDVEKALYLRRYGVPYDALAYAFGHSAMYWYRAEQTLGKFSVVGTTVKSPTPIPVNVVADEKHRWLLGERVYLTTTVAHECFLGVEVVESAGTDDLERGYRVFREEALNLNPIYQPETVNTDGWTETQSAWKLRAMALLWNFHPYGPRTKLKGGDRSSPFGELNGFVYHENWLHNLLIAGSMNGDIPRN